MNRAHVSIRSNGSEFIKPGKNQGVKRRVELLRLAASRGESVATFDAETSMPLQVVAAAD